MEVRYTSSRWRKIFRQNIHAPDGPPQYVLDDNGDVPAILGADNRCRFLISHEHVDRIVVHAAANKAKKQSIVGVRTQHEVELRFDSLLLGFRGLHATGCLDIRRNRYE